MTLGEFIQLYRLQHDLSQRQFSTKCGLSNGYISMLEKGQNPHTKQPLIPTIQSMKRLANGMNMTVQELFSSVDDMPVDISDTTSPAADFTQEERALLDKINALPPEKRAAILALLD